MDHLRAQRIDRPSYARNPDVEIDEDGGQESYEAFKAHLEAVLERLHGKLEKEFNDPEIVFLDEAGGFPVKSELTGEYYIGDTSYYSDEKHHQLMIMFRCLEKTGREWAGSPPDHDYLGLEMCVYIDRETGEITDDGAFTSSSI